MRVAQKCETFLPIYKKHNDPSEFSQSGKSENHLNLYILQVISYLTHLLLSCSPIIFFVKICSFACSSVVLQNFSVLTVMTNFKANVKWNFFMHWHKKMNTLCLTSLRLNIQLVDSRFISVVLFIVHLLCVSNILAKNAIFFS